MPLFVDDMHPLHPRRRVNGHPEEDSLHASESEDSRMDALTLLFNPDALLAALFAWLGLNAALAALLGVIAFVRRHEPVPFTPDSA